LLVEDNPGDVRLFREALRQGNLDYDLHGVADGEEAYCYLHPPVPAAPRQPDLIVLDLNLPRLSGRELLDRIRCCQDHRDTTVVVLTSAAGEREALIEAGLPAGAYFVKPDGFVALIEVVENIEEYRQRVSGAGSEPVRS
jgi:CheY-like chemotaxis protein